MKYKRVGVLAKPSLGEIECRNCGEDTRMMKVYKDENGNRAYRCGKCDEIDDSDLVE